MPSKQENGIISTYLSRRGEEGFQCRAVISCQVRWSGNLLRNDLNEEGAKSQNHPRHGSFWLSPVILPITVLSCGSWLYDHYFAIHRIHSFSNTHGMS